MIESQTVKDEVRSWHPKPQNHVSDTSESKIFDRLTTVRVGGRVTGPKIDLFSTIALGRFRFWPFGTNHLNESETVKDEVNGHRPKPHNQVSDTSQSVIFNSMTSARVGGRVTSPESDLFSTIALGRIT